jgi:hypothetical protein
LHYSGFNEAAHSANNNENKAVFCSGFCLKEVLPNQQHGHILRRLTWPPFQEVRQVEIEAGDCEGRLPLHFLVRVLGLWTWVLERLLIFALEWNMLSSASLERNKQETENPRPKAQDQQK